jgi:cell division protease FtsH
MNSTLKTMIFWAVIVLSAFLLWQSVKSRVPTQAVTEISYSDFMTRVEKGHLSRVTIAGSEITAVDVTGGVLRVIAPPNQTAMLDSLRQHQVAIWFKEKPEQSRLSWLLNLAPLILLGALWFFMIRQIQKRRSGGDGPSAYTPTQQSDPRFGP